MKTHAFLSLLIIAMAFHANAGRSVRNGGNGVKCHDSLTIELLDLHEARVFGSDLTYDPDLVEAKNPEVVIGVVIENIRKLSPHRAQAYFDTLTKGRLLSVMINGEIPVTADTGPIRLAQGCELKQVAMQVPTPSSPTEKSLIINEELYVSMTAFEKAALFIHEVVFAEAIQWNVSESHLLRPYVAYLMSENLTRSTPREFIERTLAAGLTNFEAHNRIFTTTNSRGENAPPEFNAKGQVIAANAHFGTFLPVTVSMGCSLRDIEKCVLSLYVTDEVRFYPNGRPRTFTLASSATVIALIDRQLTYVALAAGTKVRLTLEGLCESCEGADLFRF